MDNNKKIIELYKILDRMAVIELDLNKIANSYTTELNKLYKLKDKIEEDGTK